MHYLFERRLNMLEVALHGLSDAALADPGLPENLQRDYAIHIPELDTHKVKEEHSKKELVPNETPEGFHLRKKGTFYVFTYTVPYTSKEFITDILPMRSCDEGLSIGADNVVYREWDHEPIEGNTRELLRLRANAEKALADVQLTLDEYAANALEFNQLVLPVAIIEKIQAERLLRFELEARRAEGKPSFASKED
ncbi:hypothetical protein [Flaviaesturariibacter amylovorans]|uniref:DUF4230 domain-containing protein n=1 Tax=Flaviaesturariibacter amylovorans TaxID=1084520 RepID=A0ABP8GFI3_9BACT